MTGRRTSSSNGESSTIDCYEVPQDCPRLLQSYLKTAHFMQERRPVPTYYWLSQLDNTTITELLDPMRCGYMIRFGRSDEKRKLFCRILARPDDSYLYYKQNFDATRLKLVKAPLEAVTLNTVSQHARDWQVRASRGEALRNTMWRGYSRPESHWLSVPETVPSEMVPRTFDVAVQTDPARVLTAWNGYAYWQLEIGGHQVVPIGLSMDQREAAKPWSQLRPANPRSARRESYASESESSHTSTAARWPPLKPSVSRPAKVPSKNVSFAL